LGPVFNGSSCGSCHSQGGLGGASEAFVTRFGRMRNGQFDPMSEFGGSLIQAQGIGTAGTSASCDYQAESVPPEATIVARRITTPLFGLGLVDAVPDGAFEDIARGQRQLSPETAGKVNRVANLVTGRTSVGKFGWKNQNPSLAQFSADAYLNEMGITSQLFPEENCPQGDCAKLVCDPIPGIEDQDGDAELFTHFMTLLAPPARGPITRDVRSGELVFQAAGCASCHLPTLKTGPSSVKALDRVEFHPYSDFLLHDMGSLGDGIEQGEAKGRDMRTAPLWGLRVRTRFLHDGRAGKLEDAIREHDGQGRRSRERFESLSRDQKSALLAFLSSL
ncbi:MAG: hypothetical protein JNK60_22595, partial [Acidobacteria bacterium]|nr:hypothetical protein [Acidobacteriota bacterium]